MNQRFGGVLMIILGLAFIAGSFLTLNQPLLESSFPLFWAIISAGFCSCSLGFTAIRARVLSKFFIFCTIVCSAIFFVRIFMFLLAR